MEHRDNARADERLHTLRSGGSVAHLADPVGGISSEPSWIGPSARCTSPGARSSATTGRGLEYPSGCPARSSAACPAARAVNGEGDRDDAEVVTSRWSLDARPTIAGCPEFHLLGGARVVTRSPESSRSSADAAVPRWCSGEPVGAPDRAASSGVARATRRAAKRSTFRAWPRRRTRLPAQRKQAAHSRRRQRQRCCRAVAR